MADYSKSGDWGEGHHIFCPESGIATHGYGDIEAAGAKFMKEHISALDDLPVEILLAAPVNYMDGLHDIWGHAPAETRQL